MRTSGAPLGLAVLLVALSAPPAVRPVPAQEFRLPVPDDTAARQKARGAWIREGRMLVNKGDRQAAYAHYLRAVVLFPEAPEILERLLVQAPNDSDRRFWAHRYAAARTLANGSFRPGAAAAAALPRNDPYLARIAAARVRAAEDLLALVTGLEDSVPSTPLVTAWAAMTLEEITRHSPALRARFGLALNERLAPRPPRFRPILKHLAALQAKAAAAGDLERALRIAACLNGLETQARFRDLQGPRPNGLGKGKNRAAEALARLHERRRRASPPPAEVTDIERIPPVSHPGFNQRHASLGNPATCRSPGGRYRIETIAGIETLLGAARTIEAHHGRLVNWFGRDPFEGRTGRIRIVTRPADLEAEAAPSWWTSGFQRGDETVLRLAWSTTEALGRALTRQLTHRFDATIHPGLPAWLAEGRAVWAAHAYGSSADPAFRPERVARDRIDAARSGGYGEPDRLRKLIDDRIEDARDHGTAGYALYVYLSTTRDQDRLRFADRLEAFMRQCGKTRTQRFALFLRHFVDGREGRPEDFTAFASEFRAFLRGFPRPDPGPESGDSPVGSPANEEALLGDVPTWIGGRTRSEPWFGEAHARTAATLLHEAGEHELAIAAWCWSLTVDEWKPAEVSELAELLYAQWDRIGAWALRNEVRRRFPAVEAPGPEAPPSSLPREGIRELLEAFRAAARHYWRLDDPAAAAALACEHNRFAVRVGAGRLTLPDAETLAVVPAPPAESLGACGWIESGLVGYEKRRVKGLWHAEPSGDLILGRREPRARRGAPEGGDRAVQEQHAFARGRAWLSRGRYVVRARLHPETARFRGALILGYSRRDRNVRVRLEGGARRRPEGGDAKGERRPGLASVTCGIDGRFRRDRHLPGARPRRIRRFASPRSSFELEAFVDGDRVHVRVDGEPLASYRTPDSSPIEGYVGFASSRGACRVQSPVVVRLHGIPRDRLAGSWPRGLALAESQERTLTDLVNRPVREISPSAAGTVVLWIPPMGGDRDRPATDRGDRSGEPSEDETEKATEKFLATKGLPLITGLRRDLQAIGYREPPVVAVPEAVNEDARTRLRKALDSQGAVGVKILTHAWPARALPTSAPVGREAGTRPGEAARPGPCLLFLDPAATLRTVEPYSPDPGTGRLPPLLRRWAWVLAREARAGVGERGGGR